MSDLSNGQAWVIVLALPFAVWLLNQSWVRRPLWVAARPLLARLSARLTRVEEPDPETVELWNAVRRQRLQADLDRIRRLVADDAWMSATRQLGNRLAHAQLVDELQQIPVSDVVLSPWTSLVGVPTALLVDEAFSPPGSNVEIMDVGWRRSPHVRRSWRTGFSSAGASAAGTNAPRNSRV